jgi:hypothetical protein
MVKDGREMLRYKQELKDVIGLLVDKTYSKRGYQWASRMLYSILLACTNTYPLEDRFVNPDEWNSPGMVVHHCYSLADHDQHSYILTTRNGGSFMRLGTQRSVTSYFHLPHVKLRFLGVMARPEQRGDTICYRTA